MYNQPPSDNGYNQPASIEPRISLTYEEALAAGLRAAGLTLENLDSLPAVIPTPDPNTIEHVRANMLGSAAVLPSAGPTAA